MVRGTKTISKCKCCGSEFEVRVADLKRGWGLYCSKSCKAIKQESKTHQFARLLDKPTKKNKKIEKETDYATRLLRQSNIGRMFLYKEMFGGIAVENDDYEDLDDYDNDNSWDAHK